MNLRVQHENTTLSIAQKNSCKVIQKKRCISTNTHAGVQETLSTKLREEIQQLRMNHDSKHREIDTEVEGPKMGDGTGVGVRRGKRNRLMEFGTV